MLPMMDIQETLNDKSLTRTEEKSKVYDFIQEYIQSKGKKCQLGENMEDLECQAKNLN